MSSVVDWGFGGKKYHSESTDEMNEQIRILIESIKDDSIVNMDTESFTITGYPKKTATQNLQITTTTGGQITLTPSQDYVSLKCTSEEYTLSIQLGGKFNTFYLKDSCLFEEYVEFFTEKFEKQVNQDAIKSINELFNQTELKRKVDLDNLLK